VPSIIGLLVRPSLLAATGALAIGAALALPSGSAQAQTVWVVPGLLGPNALPTLPVEDAAVGRNVLVQVEGIFQFNDQATDLSFSPYFRVEIPFREVASLIVDGTPVEFWQVSPHTQAATGAANASGTTKGDLRFGAKFTIVRETDCVPAMGLRLLFKSGTGKGLEDRRFTNAPAYMIDALFAKTLVQDAGVLRRLRIMAQLGFMAWQLDYPKQDDAFDWGVAVQIGLGEAWQLETQVRAYIGWDQYTSPVVAALETSYALPPVRLIVTVTRGLSSDAPDWGIRAGLEFGFEVPYLAGPKD
jgi:hypothetical protein